MSKYKRGHFGADIGFESKLVGWPYPLVKAGRSFDIPN